MTQRSDPFHGLADTYARHRPTYPPEAFARAARGMTITLAADLGCGTGIASRLLALAVPCPVIALDPSDDMLQRARAATPEGERIRYVAATAEALPFADRSIDLIVCAQAFHWFDRDRALPEIRRVLRPHGRLALLWNVRNPTASAFARDYDVVVASAMAARRAAGFTVPDARSATDLSPWLEIIAAHRIQNPQVLREDELVGRATSASYFPREDPLRAELVAELRQTFARHADGGVVTLAQDAVLALARITR